MLTDAWTGIEEFPGSEILVASSVEEVVRHPRETPPERARAIGRAARRLVLRGHNYGQRAEVVEAAMAGGLALEVSS